MVASPVANRSRTELEGVIGLFVNTLAAAASTRTAIRRSPSSLARVREMALGARSPTRICRSRSSSRSSRPSGTSAMRRSRRCMFVVQNAVERPVDVPRPRRRSASCHRARHGEVRPDVLRGGDRRGPAAVARVLHRSVRRDDRAAACSSTTASCSQAAIEDPTRPVSELRLLSDDEQRSRRCDEWNETATSYPLERDPPGARAGRASRRVATPEAPRSCVRTARQLTYAQLDARANQLARHLARARSRAGRRSSRSAPSARSRWWWRCSPCSRPAAPTPRSTRTIPTSESRSCSTTPRAPVLLTQQRLLDGLPAHGARDRLPGRRLRPRSTAHDDGARRQRRRRWRISPT